MSFISAPKESATKKVLFKPIRVSKQDLCRYYKVDFWGTTFRSFRARDRLAYALFGRRTRRPKRYYFANQARAGRFEVLKLDDNRFIPHKKIPPHFYAIHNKERFRLYFGFTELGLRSFFLQKRHSGLRFKSFIYQPTATFFRNRPDQLLFSLGLASSPLAARELLRRSVFLINGQTFFPTNTPLHPLDLITLSSGGATLFWRLRLNYLRTLRRRFFQMFVQRFLRLRRTRSFLLRRLANPRAVFNLERFRSHRRFRYFHRTELNLLFGAPGAYVSQRKDVYNRRFSVLLDSFYRSILAGNSGHGRMVVRSRFAAFFRGVVTLAKQDRQSKNVVFDLENLFDFFSQTHPVEQRVMAARLVGISFQRIAHRLLANRRRFFYLRLGTVFLATLKSYVFLRRQLRGLLINWTPFFMMALGPVTKSFYPCSRQLKRFSTTYQQKRARRILEKTHGAFLINTKFNPLL